MSLLFVALVSFITALLTVDTSIKNGYITNFLSDIDSTVYKIPTYSPYKVSTSIFPKYTCSYSGLWCTCYSNNRGGCSVGCAPNTYYTLYNQTSCPQYENFMLAGFTIEP